MNGKNLRIVGLVSSIIGLIITVFGLYKYDEAKGMVRALGQGAALFGSTDSTYRSEAVWLSEMNNYRLVIIVGAIILVVGIILLISGIINLKSKTEKIINAELNVNEIYTYKSDEELENILEFVVHGTNLKAMVVMSSTKKLLKLYRKYESISSVVLGTGNLSGKTAKMKNMIPKEIEKISKDKIFSGRRFLFGTSALDCGVSMIDYNLSIIIIDGIYDIQSIKQIVGRKRKQDSGDVATLFIRNISNSTLNGFNSAEKRWIKPAHTLLTKGIDYYLEWYLRNGNRYPDKHRIIRDEKVNGVLTKIVNDKKLTFFENRIKRTTDMICRGKNGFLITLKDTFGINVSPWNDDAKIYTEKILEDHYQKQTVWWTRSETQEFAKSLGFTDKYRHIITSYKAINSILENQYNSTYKIVCKRKKKKVDGKVKRFDNVWMIGKSR